MNLPALIIPTQKYKHWSFALRDCTALRHRYSAAANSAVTGIPPDHNQGKAQLVLEEWIHTMKQLNKWDDLYKVAQSTGNPQLSVDCEWRLGKWDDLAGAQSPAPDTCSLSQLLWVARSSARCIKGIPGICVAPG